MTLKSQVHNCLRCGHAWRNTRATPPVKCPACTSASWDKPFQKPGRDVPRLETPVQIVERLMKAAADVLRTNSKCSVGKDLEGRYVIIPPFLLSRWRATPMLYGDIVAHLDRDSEAEDLGHALFGSRWARHAA